MYNFYTAPGTCAKSFQVYLEDMGVPYQAKYLSFQKGDQNAPEFLKINPKAQVPALQDGDLFMAEGMAIAMYLAEQNPGKSTLIPATQPARAKTFQGMAYMNTFVHGMYSTIFGAKKSYKDAAIQSVVETTARERITQYYNEMEQYYTQNKFYVGDAPTLADVMFTVMAGWNAYAGLQSFQFGPQCQRVLNAVQALPAFKSVTAKEEQSQNTQAA